MKEPWKEVASMSFIQLYISLSKTIVIIIHICPLVVTNQSAGIDKYTVVQHIKHVGNPWLGMKLMY